MTSYIIEYGGSNTNGRGFRSEIRVNGKWCYTTIRNSKTLRGALGKAKRWAADLADSQRRNNRALPVIVREIGTAPMFEVI